MAQFDAGINLEIKVTRALRAIDRVERRMAALQRKSEVEVKINSLNKTNREVVKTTNNLNKLGTALERIENETLSRLPKALQTVIAFLKAASVATDDLAKQAVGLNQSFRLSNTAGFTRDIQAATLALGRLAEEQERLQRIRNLGVSRAPNALQNRLGRVDAAIDRTRPEDSRRLTFLLEERVRLQGALNNQLRIQEDIENRIRSTQIDQNDAVRKNIRASEASRQGSGFAAFSRDASRTSGERRGASARQDLADVDRLAKGYLDALDDVDRAARADRQRRLQAELKNIETRKNAELAARDKVFKDILDTNKQLLDDFDRRLDNRQRKKRKDREDARNRNTRSRNLLLGAGFPLLFGGGPGSILGGVLGAIGGGFGSQILGSGIGSALDTAVQSAAEFAEGISKVSTALETATNANLISSKELEAGLQDLAAAGFKAAAGIQAQQEYADTISQIDFERAQDAAKSIDRVTRLWARFINSLQTDLLILIKSVADVVANQIEQGELLDRAQRTINAANRENVGTADQRFNLARQRLEFRFVPSKENKQNLIDAIKKLEDEFPILKVKAKLTIEQSQKQALQQELETVIGKQNLMNNIQSVQTIIDRYKQDSKKADDLRQRSTRAVEAAEKRIADLRLSLERKVEDMRLEAINKANRIEDEKAKQRLEKLRAAASLASAAFAASFSEDDVTKDIAVRFEKLASDLNLELAQGVEDRAKLERDFALEQRKFELQTVRIRLDAEKAVARTRESLERNLADIRKEVLRIEDNVNKDKFIIQRRLDLLALKRLEIETNILELTLKINDQLSATFENYFTKIRQIISKAEGIVNDAKPETTGGAASVPAASVGGVSFDNLNAVNDQIRTLNQELQQLLKDNAGLSKADSDKYAKRIIEATAAIQKSLTPLEQRNKLLQEQKEIERLVSEGFTESDANSIVKGEKQLKEYVKRLEQTRAGLIRLQPTVVSTFGAGSSAAQILNTQIKELDARIEAANNQAGKLKNTFKKVSEAEEVAAEVGGLLVNGLVDGLQTAVTETDRLAEAMRELASDILLAIGRALILSAIKQGIGALANNAGEPSGGIGFFSILSKAFRAGGGPVSKGQPYVVGENGSELFIPNVSGRVIPADDFDAARAAMGGGGGSDSGTVDGAFEASSSSVSSVRERLIQNEMQASSARYTNQPITFETMQIGTMDVVTREEAEAIGQASAQQARAQVFSDMRNRPSVRRQIGVK